MRVAAFAARWSIYGALPMLLASAFCQTVAPLQARTEDERRLPRVDFVKEEATLTEAITAIGLQTRMPIGVILGRNKISACSTMYRFDLHEVGAQRSLETVAHEARYSVTQTGGVIVLTAPDVTPRQRMVLAHRFADFKGPQNTSMQMISAQLSGWLWVDVDHGGRLWRIDLRLSRRSENIATSFNESCNHRRDR